MIKSYALAHAAAWDAGNAHAKAAGRKVWDESDYNHCCEVFARLWTVEDSINALGARQ
jgi:hypothetical protein